MSARAKRILLMALDENQENIDSDLPLKNPRFEDSKENVPPEYSGASDCQAGHEILTAASHFPPSVEASDGVNTEMCYTTEVGTSPENDKNNCPSILLEQHSVEDLTLIVDNNIPTACDEYFVLPSTSADSPPSLHTVEVAAENLIPGELGNSVDQTEDTNSSDSDSTYMTENFSNSSESSDAEMVSDEFPHNAEVARNRKLAGERKNWKGRPKKGRHNKYPGQTFATRKKLKDSNLTHYTVKGKLKESKQFFNFKCNCIKKCNEKISEQTRGTLFEKFWDLGSYDAQTGFIASTIREMPIKRKRAKNGPGKCYTRIYLLANTEVCRDMYIKTYQISTKRVNSALTKVRDGRLKDERGRSGGKPKIDEITIQKIIDHIRKFPTYVSHYTRAETSSKFLPFDLTEMKMYQLYIEENNQKVSFAFYKRIFYENFNLRRKCPIKDTCNKCDLFSSQVRSLSDSNFKQEIQAAHEEHLANANMARAEMQKDTKAAQTNPILETLSYDMEKVLGLPKLPTNIVYYKRQLSIYNEGIHSASTSTPYAFIWKEGVAGRGAQEVGSCLRKFISSYLKQGVQELILWSDSCGGQNRNIKIVLLLKTILAEHPTLQTIYLKYLESGHSFLQNDTDFAQIERALKHQVRIYTLDDFKSIIENCKRKNPFIVQVMGPEDFFSTKEIEKQICNRKQSTGKDKISWLRTKVIKLQKDKPYSIFMKETHSSEGDYKEIDISKHDRGRKSKVGLTKLQLLYPNGKAVSHKKAEDIKTLLRFIPLDARKFYEIESAEEFEDDIEGFGRTLDFEVEVDESGSILE